MTEGFNTIAAYSETKFKEKGSVFIGQAYPVNSEDDALKILDQVRKKYYDATHHCYAYSVFNQTKYSDAGEPTGTAGIRILNAIQHFGLNNTLLIVIRYFGGTKLGVGPLGKAYYNSAHQTLEAAEKVARIPYRKFTIEFDFSSTSQIHYILNRLNAKIQSTDYENNVIITFLLKPSESENLMSFLNDTLNNKPILKDTGELHFI